MPHDPPKGKELKALEQVMLSVHRLDELHYQRPNTTAMTIHSGHAHNGVRVNGWARLINVLDVREDVRQFRKESAKARKAAEKNDKIAEMELLKVERILSGFERCPDCDGQCGRVLSRDAEGLTHAQRHYSSNVDRWQPCETCEGRGLVIR